MSYKLTRADHLLDDQGLAQIDLDVAVAQIEEEARVAIRAIRLAASAKDDEERRDYLRVVLDSFIAILTQKERARIAAGNIDVAQRELRRLHLIPSGSKWAGADAAVA